MQTVHSISLLRQMSKAGLIKLHRDTGKKLAGLYYDKKFTCFYVADGKPEFEFNGRKYKTTYFDGCFCPFVIDVS